MVNIYKEYIIGCVGKPSSGKSTFFSSITENVAKIGNYPFTTIEPNIGITHYITKCPCKKYKVACKPKYGFCNDGNRGIPIRLFDIAGLIPGAYQGNGLGNKFLDDLRHAHILLHIIDVSGNTNEKGEQTTNYNPINDHDWLCKEIEMWIFNNVYSNWSSIVRKNKTSNITLSKLLLSQFSGYGCNESMINQLICKMKLKESTDFSLWDRNDVMELVKNFIKLRFPFVIVLNKADTINENCDSNIVKFYQKYGDQYEIVIASSLAEFFIKKMVKQNYIKLIYNSDNYNYNSFVTSEDLDERSDLILKKLDEKLKSRLENIKDMVLFRYGVTGVQDAVNKAVELLNLIPVYPVKNFHGFINNTNNSENNSILFQDCILVPENTTIKTFLKFFYNDLQKHILYVETLSGIKISENQHLTNEMNILKFVTGNTSQ